MRVIVGERRVGVGMRVRVAHRWPSVAVPVVLVMHMRVLVLDSLVHVLVRMARSQNWRDSRGHEHANDAVARRKPVAEERHRHHHADEGGGGEEGGLARRADPPRRHEVEHDARAVAAGADGEGAPRSTARPGRRASVESASPTLTAPAASVFARAIATGSRSARGCARLLSSAQAAQAAAIATTPRTSARNGPGAMVSQAPPATIAADPSASRRDRWSPKASTASAIVNGASR